MARPMSVRHCRNSGYASRLQQLRPFRIDRYGEKRWVTRLRTNVYGEWHQTATERRSDMLSWGRNEGPWEYLVALGVIPVCRDSNLSNSLMPITPRFTDLRTVWQRTKWVARVYTNKHLT